MQEISQRLWDDWAERWRCFQESYVPFRDEQLGLFAEYAAAWWNDKPLLALDLACGRGCVGERLLARLPGSRVVGVDADPWLLELGRRTARAGADITWVEADLRAPDWAGPLAGRGFQAAFTMTALHWFEPDEIAGIYRAAHGLLVDNGIFLIADMVPSGGESVQRFARQMLFRWQEAAQRRPGSSRWQDFWSEAEQEAAFRELLAARAARLGARRPRRLPSSAFHGDRLIECGFREFGEIWRFHEAAILCAIR